MNETQIEMFLRRAPVPAVPAGLLDRLMKDVAVPRASSHNKTARASQTRFPHWMPALAFSMLFLSCIIMVAVQVKTVARLKQESRELRAATASIDQLRQQHAALERSGNQADDLTKLRADNEDLHRLQAEAAALQSFTGQVSRLRTENKALTTRSRGTAQTEDLDSIMKYRAEKVACANNLKQIGLAIRIWASDHTNQFPTSILDITNYIQSPALLVCPGDTSEQANLEGFRTQRWAAPNAGVSSYQFFLTGDNDVEHPLRISAICPIHGNVLLSDGSVQQVRDVAAHEATVNGRLELRFQQ